MFFEASPSRISSIKIASWASNVSESAYKNLGPQRLKV